MRRVRAVPAPWWRRDTCARLSFATFPLHPPQMDTNCTTRLGYQQFSGNTVRSFYSARATVRSQGSSRVEDSEETAWV
jgi:hypothetical protein